MKMILKKKLDDLKQRIIMCSSIKTTKVTKALRGPTYPYERIGTQKKRKIPASNSNSAPSALVSL